MILQTELGVGFSTPQSNKTKYSLFYKDCKTCVRLYKFRLRLVFCLTVTWTFVKFLEWYLIWWNHCVFLIIKSSFLFMWFAQPSILTKVTIVLDEYFKANLGVKDLPQLEVEPQSPSPQPVEKVFFVNDIFVTNLVEIYSSRPFPGFIKLQISKHFELILMFSWATVYLYKNIDI